MRSCLINTGPTRLELATSAVTGRCSNQLNYNPKKSLTIYQTLIKFTFVNLLFEMPFKLGEEEIRTLGTKDCTSD